MGLCEKCLTFVVFHGDVTRQSSIDLSHPAISSDVLGAISLRALNDLLQERISALKIHFSISLEWKGHWFSLRSLRKLIGLY